MPIRSEDKALYPSDWSDIRQTVLERAGDCCEVCGVRNHAVGHRDSGGRFVELLGFGIGSRFGRGDFRIVLTIMHLDHQPGNCDLANLKAVCQRCHNRYDAPVRAAGRKHRLRARVKESQTVLKLNTQGMPGDSE